MIEKSRRVTTRRRWSSRVRRNIGNASACRCSCSRLSPGRSTSRCADPSCRSISYQMKDVPPAQPSPCPVWPERTWRSRSTWTFRRLTERRVARDRAGATGRCCSRGLRKGCRRAGQRASRREGQFGFRNPIRCDVSTVNAFEVLQSAANAQAAGRRIAHSAKTLIFVIIDGLTDGENGSTGGNRRLHSLTRRRRVSLRPNRSHAIRVAGFWGKPRIGRPGLISRVSVNRQLICRYRSGRGASMACRRLSRFHLFLFR